MTREKALIILEADRDTDIRGLKKKYRALMRLTHPDSSAEHDYPYEVHEINEAYNYMLSHLFEDAGMEDGLRENKIRWDAPLNPNAYRERPIYQYVEDANGNIIGTITVDNGKYMWIEDEDFPLFIRSLYETVKLIISEDDERQGLSRSEDHELMKDIMYMISGQFFGSDSAFDLMKTEDDGSYYAKTMIEVTGKTDRPKDGESLRPLKVRDHRMFVGAQDRKEIGYLTFKDDRLLFGLIPLFERRAVKIRLKCKGSKAHSKSLDADLWIKPKMEDTIKAIESINLNIRQRLNQN